MLTAAAGRRTFTGSRRALDQPLRLTRAPAPCPSCGSWHAGCATTCAARPRRLPRPGAPPRAGSGSSSAA
eukprot:3977400-Alexandrium_andersonii.AAC.1